MSIFPKDDSKCEIVRNKIWTIKGKELNEKDKFHIAISPRFKTHMNVRDSLYCFQGRRNRCKADIFKTFYFKLTRTNCKECDISYSVLRNSHINLNQIKTPYVYSQDL